MDEKKPAKKAAAKKPAAKKTPAKKTPAKKAPAKTTPAKKTSAKKTPASAPVAKRPKNLKSPAGINTGILNQTPLKSSLQPKPSEPVTKTYENNTPAPPSRLEIMKRWFRRFG